VTEWVDDPQIAGRQVGWVPDAAVVLVAYVRFYDARGGGVETSFKNDKQGLGLAGSHAARAAVRHALAAATLSPPATIP